MSTLNQRLSELVAALAADVSALAKQGNANSSSLNDLQMAIQTLDNAIGDPSTLSTSIVGAIESLQSQIEAISGIDPTLVQNLQTLYNELSGSGVSNLVAGAVRADVAQSFDETKKAQARENIGAATESDIWTDEDLAAEYTSARHPTASS